MGWLAGLLSNLLLAAWLLVQRWQRDRTYRDFGLPLAARLDRIEGGLRARRGSSTNAAFACGPAQLAAFCQTQAARLQATCAGLEMLRQMLGVGQPAAK
jgi:hypothetical protein